MSLPDRFGRYQVLDVLGQGAMGLVYKAVDPLIERAVAVKVIQTGPGLSEAELAQMSARFEQEFRSAGALSHAGIVTVYDVGKEGDLHYIAMEYVEGRSLDAILAERRILTFTQVADIACDLGAALDYAHAQGVVHRDIKPANVLIDREGRPKITDFGLAKLEATTLTRTGALVGTPAYMAPEQVAGHTITGKTDQFSLAILLYQALTGERPFTGDNPSTIMYRIAHEQPLPAGRLNPSLSPAVDDVLLRALQKDPARRFSSCVEMADGLRQALGGDPLETVAEGSIEPAFAAPAGAAPSSPEPPLSGLPTSSPAGAVDQASAAHQPSISVMQSPTPRWLLAIGIVLPSIALLAMVAWFVSTGIGVSPQVQGPAGEQPPPPATGQQDAPTTPADPATSETTPADPATSEEILAADGGQAEVGGGSSAPSATDERPALIRYSISSDPEGAAVTVDGRAADVTTPATVELATDSDHDVEIGAPGFEPYRWQVRMAGVDVESIPTNMHVALSRRESAEGPGTATRPGNSAAAGNAAAAGERAGAPGRAGDRIAEKIESFQGIPPQLQELISSGQIRTGRLVVNSRFPVGLRLVPANRFQNLSPQIRERLQNASAEDRRRLMAGFFIAQSTSHDIQLPAGNWRLTMLTPPVFFYHEEQIVLRAGETLALGERVPSTLVRVRITSDPPGARVRVGSLPAVPTPFDGLVVVGDHRFEFIWNDARALVPTTIDREGQQVVGRKRQQRP